MNKYQFLVWEVYIRSLKHYNTNASHLVEPEEVGVMCMTKIRGMRYIHKNSVVFLQLQGGAKIALRGPEGVSAETRPVALHQGQRWVVLHPPHKHGVDKWEIGRTVFEDQLHSGVNVVESTLINPQSAIFNLVGHSSRYESPTCLRLPSQSLGDSLVLNPPCQRRDMMSPYCMCLRKSHATAYIWIKWLPMTCAAGRTSSFTSGS